VRGVPELRASIGVVAMQRLDDNEIGPKVVRAAADLTEALR
jgi:hypothetical protein